MPNQSPTSTMSSMNSPLNHRVAKQPSETAPKLDRLAQQNLECVFFLVPAFLPALICSANFACSLFLSGNFADAEIVCQETTWKVHKLILRTRCPWFEKAFGSNWKVRSDTLSDLVGTLADL